MQRELFLLSNIFAILAGQEVADKNDILFGWCFLDYKLWEKISFNH